MDIFEKLVFIRNKEFNYYIGFILNSDTKIRILENEYSQNLNLFDIYKINFETKMMDFTKYINIVEKPKKIEEEIINEDLKTSYFYVLLKKKGIKYFTAENIKSFSTVKKFKVIKNKYSKTLKTNEFYQLKCYYYFDKFYHLIPLKKTEVSENPRIRKWIEFTDKYYINGILYQNGIENLQRLKNEFPEKTEYINKYFEKIFTNVKNKVYNNILKYYYKYNLLDYEKLEKINKGYFRILLDSKQIETVILSKIIDENNRHYAYVVLDSYGKIDIKDIELLENKYKNLEE